MLGLLASWFEDFCSDRSCFSVFDRHSKIPSVGCCSWKLCFKYLLQIFQQFVSHLNLSSAQTTLSSFYLCKWTPNKEAIDRVMTSIWMEATSLERRQNGCVQFRGRNRQGQVDLGIWERGNCQIWCWALIRYDARSDGVLKEHKQWILRSWL